jgi:choline dehydrogenase-like flavoprotein
MPQSEQFDVLVLGSGTGAKLIAWYMAQSGRQTAVVEDVGLAAHVQTSPVCQARMRSRARKSRTWRVTAGPMGRLLVPSPSIWRRSSAQARDGGTPDYESPTDLPDERR